MLPCLSVMMIELAAAASAALQPQLFPVADLVRDILFDRDVVRDFVPLIMNRRHRRRFPIETAVLLLVAKLTPPLATRRDRFPQFAVEICRVFSRLHDARILAQHLGRSVAGHLGEPRVDKLDAARRIGDDHTRGALFDGEHQLVQLLFPARGVGDILGDPSAAVHVAVLVEYGKASVVNPANRSAGLHDPIFHRVRAPR